MSINPLELKKSSIPYKKSQSQQYDTIKANQKNINHNTIQGVLLNKEDLNLQIKDIINNFKTLDSAQLSRKITKTLNFLKKDKEVLNILCC